MSPAVPPDIQPARLRCYCCALPSRLLHHVAAKADGAGRAALLQHDKASAHIRAHRRSKADRPDAAARRGPDVSASRLAVYDAGGGMRLPGKLARREGGAPVADKTVNDAYGNVAITLDFYAQVFGRKSLDDRGMRIDASVHYGERFTNAMWSGKEMLIGDGDGVHVLGFAHCLDIVAHELTHAVTQHTIAGGLGEKRVGRQVRLAGEAGALNESLADVFSSMVKQWHLRQDVHRANWLVGEGILAPGLGKAVRSLKDPGNPVHTYEADDQAKDMTGYVPGGDVHSNSGIPNHAFYLAAVELGGHSWERAGAIWYRAMQALQSNAGFVEAAGATSAAAAALFGAGSREERAVAAAWRKVKVTR